MKCFAIENHPADSRVTMDNSGIVQTLSARMGTGGGNTPMVLIVTDNVEREFAMTNAYCAGNGQLVQAKLHNVVNCLDCMHDQKMILHDMGENNMEDNSRKYVLRRLTPVECARLQGFPDWWCDGADGSDSAQYKLWGNGIALPCAVDVLGRIAEEMRKDG